MDIKREFSIVNILGENQSGLLLGARGTGKTALASSWLKASKSGTLFYDLLDFEDFSRLSKNPSLIIDEIEYQLVKDKKVTVLIDEVQKIPELLNQVHLLIEKHKKRVQFLLTGSSARKLKQKGVNLLAGRALSMSLHPFTVFELDKKWSLENFLKFGSLPIIYSADNPAATLRTYVQTYLKEEIQQEALVRKLEKFFRFIEVAAQLNGETINASKFAKQIGVSDKAIKDYLQILIDTLLMIELPGWDRSLKKQIVKSSKYYFFDCGVLNTASGELNDRLREGTPRYGRLFETLIINEIYRQNAYHSHDYRMNYYSTGDSEVDLILSRGRNKLKAIEIKSAQKVELEDINGLLKFHKEYPNSELYCICRAKNPYKLKLDNKVEIEILPYQLGIKKLLQS